MDIWTEVEIRNYETGDTGDTEMSDICDGQHSLEEKQVERYLGDIKSTDGKNIKDIKARIGKGKRNNEHNICLVRWNSQK